MFTSIYIDWVLIILHQLPKYAINLKVSTITTFLNKINTRTQVCAHPVLSSSFRGMVCLECRFFKKKQDIHTTKYRNIYLFLLKIEIYRINLHKDTLNHCIYEMTQQKIQFILIWIRWFDHICLIVINKQRSLACYSFRWVLASLFSVRTHQSCPNFRFLQWWDSTFFRNVLWTHKKIATSIPELVDYRKKKIIHHKSSICIAQ